MNDVDHTIFEPIPEILQSILVLRCSFSILKLEKSTSKTSGTSNDLTEENMNKLKDDLEHFQQKLKIAIRKKKDDKISKYQKKIDYILMTLSENKQKTISQKKCDDLDVPLEQIDKQVVDPVIYSRNNSNDSDVTFHFSLDADEEKMIIVNLLCLPGMAYRKWLYYKMFI
jgi:hypothetical protein